jgi:septum site-determining protein MinD
MNSESDAALAYQDAVDRLLGEKKPMRFTEAPKRGLFARMFGG